MSIELGVIKVVNPRTVWSNEEYDFTPWLAENIEELSNVIGIPILVEETEKRVGKYELDIYGKVEGTNDIVVIENQLEASDHRHLGQLLTYASGLGASIIIWVTPRINDEHKQAVEWLNEISHDETSFFLIRPEIIQIDDSLPAARFHLEAGPNDFERTIKSLVSNGERRSHQIRRIFWSELIDYCKDNNYYWGANRRTTKDHWLSFAVGKSGFSTIASFAKGSRMRAELSIETPDMNENKRIFEELQKYKVDIENEYEIEISWERLEGKKVSRLAIYSEYDKDKFENEIGYRIEYVKWIAKYVEVFKEIFSNYIINKSLV